MQTFDLQVFSPAKVNLFFKVMRKRDDGYHEIASLMQALDFGDTLFFSLLDEKKKDEFISSEPSLAFEESNLIYKAAQLFKKETNKQFSLCIKLDKKIPIGAGLGGGSSNAAATLYALDRLLKTNLPSKTLQDMGKKLGADVPFFFSSGTAFCTGIGEILEDVTFKEFSFWLAKPIDLSVATPLVYKHHKVLSQEKGPEEFMHAFHSSLNRFISLTENDLEQSAFSLVPKLQEIKQQLFALGFTQVVMTGSGSAFLCFGDLEKPNLSHVAFQKVTTLSKKQNPWFESS